MQSEQTKGPGTPQSGACDWGHLSPGGAALRTAPGRVQWRQKHQGERGGLGLPLPGCGVPELKWQPPWDMQNDSRVQAAPPSGFRQAAGSTAFVRKPWHAQVAWNLTHGSGVGHPTGGRKGSGDPALQLFRPQQDWRRSTPRARMLSRRRVDTDVCLKEWLGYRLRPTSPE